MSSLDNLRSSILNYITIPHPVAINPNGLTGLPPELNIELHSNSLPGGNKQPILLPYNKITNKSWGDRTCSGRLILHCLIHIKNLRTYSDRSILKYRQLNGRLRWFNTIRRKSADGQVGAFVTNNIPSLVRYIRLKGVNQVQLLWGCR
jgi:hypothetical protein